MLAESNFGCQKKFFTSVDKTKKGKNGSEYAAKSQKTFNIPKTKIYLVCS